MRTSYALISSTSRTGRSQLTREAILFQKFQKGTITTEELREYALIKARRKSKECYTKHSGENLPKCLRRLSDTELLWTNSWGFTVKITQADYEAHPNAFK